MTNWLSLQLVRFLYLILAVLLANLIVNLWVKSNNVTQTNHVTIWLWWVTSYRWSIVTMRLSGTITEIWCLKDNTVTTLTFWGHVTSSVTWPFDSAYVISYWWSIVTMRLTCSVREI